MTTRIARGERISNPLNIRHGTSKWRGAAAEQPDSAFVAFESPEFGIRAATVLLRNYRRLHGLDTVEGIIRRWAPPEDHNDTQGYIATVCREMGVGPKDKLDMDSPNVLFDLIVAMMRVEIGRVPYEAGTIMAGVRLGFGEDVTPPLVDQPSPAPTRKVSNGALGSLAGIPVAWLLKAVWDTWIVPGEPMPADIAIVLASALTTGFYFAVAWMTRERAVTCVPPVK